MVNSNEYMRDYMQARYYERREIAIIVLGEECAWCGYRENLEIDHIEREGVPHNRKFSRMWNMAYDKFILELKRCHLLCYDCHKEKTRMEASVGHGEGVTGKRNCYCNLCKPLKQVYMKDRY